MLLPVPSRRVAAGWRNVTSRPPALKVTAQRMSTSLPLLSPGAFQQNREEAEQSAVGAEGRGAWRRSEPSAWVRSGEKTGPTEPPAPGPDHRVEPGWGGGGRRLQESKGGCCWARPCHSKPGSPGGGGTFGRHSHLFCCTVLCACRWACRRLKGPRPRPGPCGGAVSSGRLRPECCGQRTEPAGTAPAVCY